MQNLREWLKRLTPSPMIVNRQDYWTAPLGITNNKTAEAPIGAINQGLLTPKMA